MRSQLRTKTFSTVLFLAGICLIVISYPKAFNVAGTDLSGNLDSIGSITSVTNDARLKKFNLFNWTTGSVGAPLAQGDLVFTNIDSQAKLKLGQGHEVSLTSETLLKIKAEELEVKNGSVELTIGKNMDGIRIKVGRETYTLLGKIEDTKVSITSSAGKSKFSVSEGGLNIKGRGVNVNAKKGEEVIASSQSLSKVNMAVEQLYPVNQSVLLRPDEQFQLKVKGAPKGSYAIVTTAGDQIRLPINSNIKLLPGQYTWSVAKGKEALSAQKFFELKLVTSPPNLIAPENLATLYTFENNSKVEFIWKGGPSSHRLQAYDSSGRLVISKGGLTTVHTASMANEGTYSWQVRAEGQNRKSDWSDPRTFVLIRKDYKEGEPLVIELERPDQLARFDWKSSESGDRFILSKRPDFSSALLEKVVDDQSSLETIVPEVGVYYWKIIKENGGPSSAKPHRVLIRPTPPPTKPNAPPSLRLKLKDKSASMWEKLFRFISPIPSAFASEFEETVVSFEKIDRAKAYEVEIYADKKLQKQVYKTKTSRPSFKWSPPRAGRYYWRIRFQDHWERWSPYSDPSRLSLSYDRPRKEIVKSASPKSSSIKKELEYNSKLEFGHAPSSISYIQDGTETFEVQGEALGGHGIGISYKMYGLDYRSSYGKVFNGEPFFDRSIEAYALFTYKGLRFGPSLMAGQTLSYLSDEDKAKEDSSLIYYGVGAQISKSFDMSQNLQFDLGGSAHTLGANAIALFIKLSYSWMPQIGISAYLEAEQLSVKNTDHDIGVQTIRTFFGPYYKF